ncbi:uncharacterized protein LOC142765911 [Rhipicephalus microplus]|uniref:uncharacterized protein LOC142765911 n=1 Tax=Rhipicephalus microplus TaxID=6941 RepID=UPI003F6BDE00
MRTLREILARERDRALHDLPNQGKVLACVAADRSSSHFMRTGAFTTFADWRFVHRARLNLLPLNGARMWGAPDRDQRCRVCGYLRETLPHVVCHCMPRCALYRARHDAIVNRVRTAASREFTVSFENQAIGDTGLRPNLVLVRGEEAIVIDVTCPFKNTPDGFENARNAKLAHYELVVAFLHRRYQRVTMDAVIVGAFGAWDSRNDRVPSRGLGHPGKATFLAAPALSEGHLLLLLTGGASRSWTLDVADLLTLEALDVLAGPGDPRVLDGGR